MAAEHGAGELVRVVALLGAAVVAVPLFRRMGLGSVLGYLAAGLAIGPFGLAWFTDPAAILHVAELGVVMFLFVVGLEMRPSQLWQLRKQIFLLGGLQVGLAALAMTGVGVALGLAPMVSFLAAAGFVLTSTAIVMQVLGERGDIALPRGRKMVSILLFEDLLIVPLLALVAFLAPAAAHPDSGTRWQAVLLGTGALVGLVAAGLWLLNPLFRILARAGAREVMTAAALLVVLGAALLMDLGGLSMAMGAFLAGVLLSESAFRHQLEADIEPFRGLLLGLFFLAVGMSLDLAVVASDWRLILIAVPCLMLAKGLCIYLVARWLGSGHGEALDRAVLMAQGGEFAFVLFAAAQNGGLLSGGTVASLSAIVVLSMVLTPLVVLVARRFMPRAALDMSGVEAADGLAGSVLLIGFGRFGQVASQALLARGVDVTAIDKDIEMIQSAADFGFKVYYGDGTRLDVLHASGAGSARAIAVCVDTRAEADRIAELCLASFPQARLLVRSFDRQHALKLTRAGVDYTIRETFESAVEFGSAALRLLGADSEDAARIATEVRKLDAERFTLELAGQVEKGRSLMLTNTGEPRMRQTPLLPPQREGQVLNAGESDEAGG
ncbi:MAG TPA: monovalent cation:proton antiporter-2 (CPA2) family protein [Arenimonas sp.]|nr:monovalent cation:proton antiporter-2 (CPA2) family protein [Arenimonas sp.]